MDLGFETIGNATIVCHDGGPVLATDPWTHGSAYFGSWILSHEVPQRQREAIAACPYLWISHGHPDHLNLPCLEPLRDKQILLADHHGGRIARELRQLGFRVLVLQDGAWTQLSDRLRIATVANYNQDAVLLIDLDGTLLIDANDAGDRGASTFLRAELPRFRRSFLMCLTGYGDADMINFFDEQGSRIPPPAAQKQPVGPQIAEILQHYGIDGFCPSSSMHRYQRTDSAWANQYSTPIDAHAEGFPLAAERLLPAFIRFDLRRDSVERIEPRPNPEILVEPAEYGDDWSTPLDRDDVRELADYFGRVTHLQTFLGYLNFRVGGRDHSVDVHRAHPRGITFETPRHSLMQAIRWRAFDDILIGNFCKTTLHGDWDGRRGADALYPDFTPFVTKYGDNGGARAPDELRVYFRDYLRRGFTEFGPAPADREAAASIRPYLRED